MNETSSNLNKLVDRMEAITGRFRFFARGCTDKKTRMSLATVLEEASGRNGPRSGHYNLNSAKSAIASHSDLRRWRYPHGRRGFAKRRLQLCGKAI